MAQKLSDFDIYAKYDVPKIYLGIALLVFLIIGGVTGYIIYKNPAAATETDELAERLSADKNRLQNALSGVNTEIRGATVSMNLGNLEREVTELVGIAAECDKDLVKCNADLITYENPVITCGNGTVKKNGYCHKIGLEETDFETRGAGVLMGVFGIMILLVTKKEGKTFLEQ